MPSPYYVDSSWTGAQNGTESEPYSHWNQVALASNDTVLIKRGSVFTESYWLIQDKDNTIIDSYGNGELPVFSNFTRDANPTLWVDQGGNVWRRDTGDTGTGAWGLIFQLGADLQPIQIKTDRPLPLVVNGDWDSTAGDGGAVTGKIDVYCDQNPVSKYGYVDWTLKSDSCFRYNRGTGNIIRNIKIENTGRGVYAAYFSGADGMNVTVDNCELDNCWFSVSFQNPTGGLLYSQDCVVSNNLLTNSRSVGVHAAANHRNLIIEDNVITNTGTQASVGGIYSTQGGGSVSEPQIIRNNLVDGVYYGRYWFDGDGIYQDGYGDNFVVYGNIIKNIGEGGAGLRNNAGSDNCLYYSNIIDTASEGVSLSHSQAEPGQTFGLECYNNIFVNVALGIEIRSSVDVGAVTAKNNVCVGTDAVGSIGNSVSADATATLTIDHNSYYGFENNYDGIADGAGDVTTDPQVLSDYILQPTSPCLGTGDASVLPLADYSGRSHGLPINMGAYALPQLATNLLASNTGNTAVSQNYDGVWDSSDWLNVPDNSRFYPMNEAMGDRFYAYDSEGTPVPGNDAVITGFSQSSWLNRR